MRSSYQPSAQRLSRSTLSKIKGVNLCDNQNYWDSFWGVNWNEAELTTQINFCKTLGVNCLKVYFDGMTSGYYGGNGYLSGTGYPADKILRQRVKWFCDFVRSRNMFVFLAMNQSIDFVSSTAGQTELNIAKEITYLQLFMQYGSDLVVTLDICNEINSGGTTNIWRTVTPFGAGPVPLRARQDLTTLAKAVRVAFPDLPITASVFVDTKSALTTNGWLDLQYELGLDYHGWHPYFGFGADGAPVIADGASIEGRPKFIGRHLIDECGIGRDQLVRKGLGYQAKWVEGMGNISRRSACLGAVYFHSRPYYQGSSSQGSASFPRDGFGYALFNSDLSQTNISIAQPLSAWPG